MKTTFTTTALAAALLAMGSTGALAQSAKQSNFTGLGLGVAVSSVRNTFEVTSGVSDFGNTSSEAALVGSYGYAMGKDWVGTLGVSLALKNSDYGSYTSGSTTSTATARKHMAFSFAPGYRLGSDGLVYAKLGLHQMDVNYTSTSGFDLTKTHQGTGWGFGYAAALTPNLELRAEYEVVNFNGQDTSTTNTSTPKQSSLNFALVYKF